MPHDDTRPADARSSRSAPAPAADFIDHTLALWQPRTARRLTREDAREIIENVTGFFHVLQEWDRKERQKEASNALPPDKTASQAK